MNEKTIRPIAVFVKKRHAMSAEDYETWEECEAANTLNTFDGGGGTRATTLVVHGTDNIDREDSV